jgi:hypothetical protein
MKIIISRLDLLKVLISSLIFSLTVILNAQWSADPTVNTPVVTHSNQQNSCKIVSDGSGGAIVIWWDYDVSLSNDDYNIYAQRINAAGVMQWDARGVPICTNSAMQHVPHVASDGAGGALIAWIDKRNIKNEVFAQRIGPDGIVKWTANGVAVGTATDHYQQGSPEITSDGSGGAIITFDDWRNTFENPIQFISAQRISSSGSIVWPAGGVALNGTAAGEAPRIVGDGSGGAIIAWHQWTGDPLTTGNLDIYAQKISASGSLAWGVNALAVCSQTNNQLRTELTSDGSGGAIISWQDLRHGSYSTIYAQKVSASGENQWTANGIRLSTYTTSQESQILLPDGSGGAFIAWQGGGLLVQHLSTAGVKLWSSEGISPCNLCSGNTPQMISDNAGGVILAWREGTYDIFAQRLNSAGDLLWWPGTSFSKAYICVNSWEQYNPVLTTDGNSGAIIAWDDRRNYLTNGYNTDIYAQQINRNKDLGLVTAVEKNKFTDELCTGLDQNFPNPFSSSTTIRFRVAAPGNVTIKIFNIYGQEVRDLMQSHMEPGDYSVQFNGSNLPQGIYYCRLITASGSITRSLSLIK